MKDALKVTRLNKAFKDFSLKDVSFTVPAGRVVGMVGENGSGKSTTIRCILGQDIPQSGEILMYGENALDNARLHNQIGYSGDSKGLPGAFTPKEISSIMKTIYENWQEDYFFRFLDRFQVPLDRKIAHLSRGMYMKLSIATALAHQPDLLLLDEATAGLDPVVREEILDLLQEFMEDENHAILMTSHITSDLERIADSILYIQDGKILFELDREEIDRFGIAQLTADQVQFVDEQLILAARAQSLHTEMLVKDRTEFSRRYPDYAIHPATLDEMIVMLSKGQQKGESR